VRAYWISEADQISESNPTLRTIRVEPHEMATLVYATDKSLRNSAGALEQYITRATASAMNRLIADAIINGNGTGKPLGLNVADSTVTVSKETSQAADTVLTENISKMWTRLHPNFRNQAIWLMNPDVEPELDNLFTAVKNVASTENVGGITQRLYNPDTGTLKGRPIVYTDYCSTLGDKGDIILWAPQTYITVTRGQLRSAQSMHLRFDYAETAFRVMFEVDGRPWMASAVTPPKGSNTRSTQVNLAARS
jgi:HK97 family phage major capsid protein